MFRLDKNFRILARKLFCFVEGSSRNKYKRLLWCKCHWYKKDGKMHRRIDHPRLVCIPRRRCKHLEPHIYYPHSLYRKIVDKCIYLVFSCYDTYCCIYNYQVSCNCRSDHRIFYKLTYRDNYICCLVLFAPKFYYILVHRCKHQEGHICRSRNRFYI